MRKMLCEYRLTMRSLCPNDDVLIEYSVCLSSHSIIMVEDLLEFSAQALNIPMFQESLTEKLSEKFQAKVVTKGTHQNVALYCEVDI